MTQARKHMARVVTSLMRTRDTESGQGMVEYGLLVALISVAALVVILLLGPQLTSTFQTVLNNL